MVPGQRRRGGRGGAALFRRRCRRRPTPATRAAGWNCSAQASNRRAAPPGQLDGLAHPAVAAAQHAFQQARLDVVALQLHAPQPLSSPQELVGLSENTRGAAWRSTGRASAAWARSSTRWPPPWPAGRVTSLPSREIVSAISMMPSRSVVAFAGQAAHEIQLHPRKAVLERPAAAGVEVVVGDRLADLLAACRRGRPPGPASGREWRSVFSSSPTVRNCSLIRRLGSETPTPSGRNVSCSRRSSSSKCGIIAGGKRQQRDLVVARVAVRLHGRLRRSSRPCGTAAAA